VAPNIVCHFPTISAGDHNVARHRPTAAAELELDRFDRFDGEEQRDRKYEASAESVVAHRRCSSVVGYSRGAPAYR
jgi:hypothetical protein